MKAFTIDRYGSNDNVHAVQVPDPQLRDDDVLVEIHAASINPLDAKIRDGKVKTILPYHLPVDLGQRSGRTRRPGRLRSPPLPARRPGLRPPGPASNRHLRRVDLDQARRRRAQADRAHHGRGGLPPPRRSDRVASPCRTGRSEAGSKGSHPCRLRRPGIHRDSAGPAISVPAWPRQRAPQTWNGSSTSGPISSSTTAPAISQTVVHDYDVVFDPLGGDTLNKSFGVLKPGGSSSPSPVRPIPNSPTVPA